MRNAWIAFGAAAGLAAPLALAQDKPIEVVAPVEKVFVPTGFDDNDNVEIIVHGQFGNSCYRVGQAQAEVDKATNEIKAYVTAYFYPGAVCAQVEMPYIEPVKVGLLDFGNYSVSVNRRSMPAEVNVKPSESVSPDDYLYAPVDSADLAIDDAGNQTLYLTGTYPLYASGCMVMREIMFERNPDDVLVVLPKAEVTHGPECARDSDRFKYAKPIPQAEALKGTGLVHVRVMNGKSFNLYVDAR